MRSAVLAFFLLATSHTVLAQNNPPPSSSEPSVQALLERIQQLEKRISDLEARENNRENNKQATLQPRAAPPGEVTQAQPPPPVPPSPAGGEHDHLSNATVVREAEEHYPSLQIRGFGDVDFSASDQKDSVSGFNLGQFVLHFASPLSRKVSYFGEVSFTAQPASYELQVERSIIRYDYND
ncbi:MAG: hypothetical protein DMG93_20715, partial [Acidobacteria bacterium]